MSGIDWGIVTGLVAMVITLLISFDIYYYRSSKKPGDGPTTSHPKLR